MASGLRTQGLLLLQQRRQNVQESAQGARSPAGDGGFPLKAHTCNSSDGSRETHFVAQSGGLAHSATWQVPVGFGTPICSPAMMQQICCHKSTSNTYVHKENHAKINTTEGIDNMLSFVITQLLTALAIQL